MANPNPNTTGLTPFPPGVSGNPNGKPKGTKSLSTIIKELEAEDFTDWDKIPIKPEGLKKAKEIGAPLRAIVYTALAKAYAGDIKAAEWLRKAGYGDKLDLTTKGERIRQEPVIVSAITPRQDANTETETTDSPGVS